MSVEIYRESPRKFYSRTLNRTTLNRWTGRTPGTAIVFLQLHPHVPYSLNIDLPILPCASYLKSVARVEAGTR